MRKLLDWMFNHVVVSTLILVVASVFAFIGIIDWAAESDWRTYCKEARLRGVDFSAEALIPPEVPEEKNIGALPLFRKGAGIVMRLPSSSHASTRVPRPLEGGSKDWNQFWSDCQNYFLKVGYLREESDSGPRDVLLALQHYAPQFEQWRQWSQRPLTRFPFDYATALDSGTWDWDPADVIVPGAILFDLRMRANLALGDSKAAYADFQDGIQGYHALESQTNNKILSCSVVRIMLSGLGQGLSEHRWEARDLGAIQADLEKINLWHDYLQSLRFARFVINATFEGALDPRRIRPNSMFQRELEEILPRNQATPLIPPAFYRMNQLRANKYIDELAARVSAGIAYNPDVPNPSSPEYLDTRMSRMGFYAFGRLGVHEQSSGRAYAKYATLLEQAILACALERFRLANRAFPISLDELVPNYVKSIPTDCYSRKPMIYRLVGEKSFVLYSVGENRIDDGGVIDPKRYEIWQADDIWLYAPPAAP